jgi:quercetin dioxygenase-like cupin family protein
VQSYVTGELAHDSDELRRFDHGQLAVVDVAGVTVGRVVFKPGWRWSDHLRPLAGTGSCQVAHVGYILSGRIRIRMDDGSEATAGPGDAFVVSPGHDGWVVGDEPCVMLDGPGGVDYARSTGPGPRLPAGDQLVPRVTRPGGVPRCR